MGRGFSAGCSLLARRWLRTSCSRLGLCWAGLPGFRCLIVSCLVLAGASCRRLILGCLVLARASRSCFIFSRLVLVRASCSCLVRSRSVLAGASCRRLILGCLVLVRASRSCLILSCLVFVCASCCRLIRSYLVLGHLVLIRTSCSRRPIPGRFVFTGASCGCFIPSRFVFVCASRASCRGFTLGRLARGRLVRRSRLLGRYHPMAAKLRRLGSRSNSWPAMIDGCQ